ncbi:MAG TPA: type II toxin-antitoxin system RelB/DinJ family antitoxin [Candidatus Pacearchaeota archaeon]|nr:type II toxin-antitoxin system RelB/DinJ family antitoxin [Candidatus Pacearchaeota archaeon]HPO06879.1 type II toxin-antitoxin system RelB/DinJ family antitoxin [Candidatus Pacearchaeota archaeon]
MSEVIHFRTEKKAKDEAQAIAKKMGLKLSDVLNALLYAFIRTRELNIRLEEPSDYFIECLEQAREDLKNGDISPAFDNAEDAIKWLHDKNRKYANQI